MAQSIVNKSIVKIEWNYFLRQLIPKMLENEEKHKEWVRQILNK